MATKNKVEAEVETDGGVPVRTFETRTRLYEDGVPVLTDTTASTTDEPAQTAGTENGQSAGKKEN